MTHRQALHIAWRALAALAFLFSCGAALALGPVDGDQPVAVFWFAGLGSASAFGGWLAWNSISSSRLREQLNLIDTAFRCVDVAVVGLDDCGQVFFANAAAAKLAGVDHAEVIGQSFELRFPLRNAADGKPVLLQELQSACGDIVPALRAVLRDAGDNERVLDISCAREDAGRRQVSFLAMEDVSIPHGISLELFWQANHDALTGLVNRRGFEEQLRKAITAEGAPDKRHTLLFLDLDRFKLINDSGGHAAGDEFLRQIAAVLRARVRTSDVLARMGGDEFAVLLHACPVEQALRIANAIRMDVSNFRFVWREKVFHVGASIGLVVMSDPAAGADEVMEQADAACYAAKEAGRDQIRVYHAKATSHLPRVDMNIVETIHDAIERNGFRLFRQRIAGLDETTSKTRHFELLLRMVDREGKIVPPMAFIPSAERHNMMQAIDRWVLSNALPAIRRECEATPENMPVFDINLSAESINDSRFPQFVREQIALHRTPPEAICFEITETLAVANLTKAAELIRELKELGLRFALDDFGAGMCSFAYLKHLPVDYVKIDGAFVRDMFAEPMNLEVVSAINNIAHSLGMKTIAEFVETEGTLNRLREMGVDYAQGHAVGRPFYFS
ncbi:MAG: EAL domain-containing protein [Gallionellaceae bacterium]|nr:EAL domain-containing protein [Gallionellaceae bacterium]